MLAWVVWLFCWVVSGESDTAVSGVVDAAAPGVVSGVRAPAVSETLSDGEGEEV